MMEQQFLGHYEQMHSLLAQEENATNASREAIASRVARRKQIEEEWAMLRGECDRLWRRYQYLPELPNQEIMDWARAVLAMPNLRFLVLDTTGVDDHADIIRLYVADREGSVMFDRLVNPERHDFEAANTRYTGIEAIDLEQYGEPLVSIWHNFTEAVQGHYILCYGFSFVQQHLNESAEHYGLAPIHLIGEDLQEKARRFFASERYYPLKLIDVASRIGYALPTPVPAHVRAQAQLAVLKAMAEGNTGVTAPRPRPVENEDEESAF